VTGGAGSNWVPNALLVVIAERGQKERCAQSQPTITPYMERILFRAGEFLSGSPKLSRTTGNIV
jgi:hypothetical protein